MNWCIDFSKCIQQNHLWWIWLSLANFHQFPCFGQMQRIHVLGYLIKLGSHKNTSKCLSWSYYIIKTILNLAFISKNSSSKNPFKTLFFKKNQPRNKKGLKTQTIDVLLTLTLQKCPIVYSFFQHRILGHVRYVWFWCLNIAFVLLLFVFCCLLSFSFLKIFIEDN